VARPNYPKILVSSRKAVDGEQVLTELHAPITHKVVGI